MWITRKYEKTLKSLFSQFPAVVLTGARQVGKTALVRRVFPDAQYISLHTPTGSQNFLLMERMSESLAGRCGVLNMLNLCTWPLKHLAATLYRTRYLQSLEVL